MGLRQEEETLQLLVELKNRKGPALTKPILLQGACLAGEDLRNIDLTGADLTGADLSGADLSGARLFKAKLKGANLVRANLRNAELSGADLSETNMEEVQAANIGLGMATLHKARLFRANLERATLTKADLTGADLRCANLRHARIREALLTQADLTSADLRESDLSLTDVAKSTFNNADLRGARLRILKGYKKTRWYGVDIREINFAGAYLMHRFIIDQNYLKEFREKNRLNRILYYLWWITSDCGRSLGRWFLWIEAQVLLFAWLYTLCGVDYGDYPTWLSPLYYSVVTLTTLGYGDIVPASAASQSLVIIEVTLGYIMLGGLLSIFSNKLARRGD